MKFRLFLLLALVLGTAGCQVSVATGVLGALFALGTGVVFLLLSSGTQTGCSSGGGPLSPCLSVVAPPDPDARVPDAWAGPCLSMPMVPVPLVPPEPPISPCLSPMPPPRDAGVPRPDARIGPCLSIAPPRRVKPPPRQDPPLQICLSDIDIAPCLKVAPEPEGGGAANTPPGTLDEAAVLARVMDRLPPDVAARLRSKGDT